MRCSRLMLLVLVLLLPLAANASPITFRVNLSPASEIPPTISSGTGTATIILDPVAQTLQLNIVFSGLTSNVTAAHIHCCLATPFALVNVGVATAVPAFPGFPTGVTSGSFNSVVFDLTQPTIYNPAFITSFGGSLPQAEAAFIAGIQNGGTYLNIHTANNPGGEIRGFLIAAPEPAGWLLLASGVAGVLIVSRRKLISVR